MPREDAHVVAEPTLGRTLGEHGRGGFTLFDAVRRGAAHGEVVCGVSEGRGEGNFHGEIEVGEVVGAGDGSVGEGVGGGEEGRCFVARDGDVAWCEGAGGC